MMKLFITYAAFMITMTVMTRKASAQDSTTPKPLTVSGYVEAYYSYDFNRPVGNTKPFFLYNFNRNNELNLNLAYIKVAYATGQLRANIALGTGTYMNANYGAEPGALKNIYEANAGLRISKKADLWVDAGVFSSHIGFESARGKDCWALTRSLVAENTPYYETGIKLGYTSSNRKWYLSALLLNGWQRIQRPEGNTTPAFGTQITYTPSEKVLLNYSTFTGNDKPDSIRLMRYYHNFYTILQLNKQWGAILGFDLGMEQKTKGSAGMNMLYTPVLILKYTPDEKNSIAGRFEYYDDADGIVISSGTSNGFKTIGWSVNYDRQITANAVWRTGFRRLQGRDNYFINKENVLTGVASYLTTSLAISF